jgi:carbonic anhydrase/acetyltransferase-like protein (isoleucine patch superfamily)
MAASGEEGGPVHPAIDPTAYLAPGAVVLGDVVLGPESSVWYGAVLRGDVERITVGAQSNIQDLSILHADPGVPCTIGARVTVGHRAILHGCTVEDDCLIGMGSIVLNRAVIGAGSVIGAGALVREGQVIPPGSVAVGMPARVVKAVDEASRRRIERGASHYVAQSRRHRDGRYPLEPTGNG